VNSVSKYIIILSKNAIPILEKYIFFDFGMFFVI